MNEKCESFSAGNVEDLAKAVELWAASMPQSTKIQYLNMLFNPNTGEFNALITYLP